MNPIDSGNDVKMTGRFNGYPGLIISGAFSTGMFSGLLIAGDLRPAEIILLMLLAVAGGTFITSTHKLVRYVSRNPNAVEEETPEII